LSISFSMSGYFSSKLEGKEVAHTRPLPLTSIAKTSHRAMEMIKTYPVDARPDLLIDFFEKTFVSSARHREYVESLKLKKGVISKGLLTDKIISKWTPLCWTIWNLFEPFVKPQNEAINLAMITRHLPIEMDVFDDLIDKWLPKKIDEKEISRKVASGKVSHVEAEAISDAMVSKHGESLDFLDFLMGLTVDGKGIVLLEAIQKVPELMYNLAKDETAINHFISLAGTDALLEIVSKSYKDYETFKQELLKKVSANPSPIRT